MQLPTEKRPSDVTSSNRDSRSAINSASWNSFGTLCSVVISFVLAPVLIGHLGAAQYGLLLLIWSFTGILGLIGLGFGEATLRYVAHYFGEKDMPGANRIIGATMTLYLTVAGLACAGVFISVSFVLEQFPIAVEEHDSVGWLMRIAALMWGLRAVSWAHSAVPMALQRYDLTSKLSVVQNILRSVGLVGLALAGFGVVHLVLWELVSQVAMFLVQIIVVRRIAPGILLTPSFSFAALREIAGFSLYSFLTFGFLTVQRESGKLILAAKLGTVPVAYFGTPDNLAQRIHMVVASGSETLMPRFSANRNLNDARALVWFGTWSALVVSLLLLVPLVVLMPDFLALWISPIFSAESAAVGQLLVLSYISQGAYTPIATYFRGINEPSKVTVVIGFAGGLTLLANLVLIPRLGVLGAGFACLLGSLPTLVGVMHGWFHVFGKNAFRSLVRMFFLPLLMAGIAACIQILVRGYFDEIDWFGLFGLGGLFVAITFTFIFGADWVVGGEGSPSKRLAQRIRIDVARRILQSRQNLESKREK